MSNFEPLYSTDSIFYGENINRFLTTDIDNFEADIASLKTSVNGLGNTYALKNHTHTGYATADDVASLQSSLAGKADVNHTHTGYATTSSVASLQSSLQASIDGKANINHTHEEYATTDDVQTALDGKANANHTHTEYALTNHTHTGYAATGHNHDDRYYAKADVDSMLSDKADASTMSIHTDNDAIHVSSDDRFNWEQAAAHASMPHAPSDANANQNAYTRFRIGRTYTSANTTEDTFTFIAGDNVTLTPDVDNNSLTIAATGGSTYVHPITAGNKHIPAGGSAGQILNWSADGTAIWGDNLVSKSVTTAGTGAAYTATVPGIDALESGVSFVMIPHITSTSKTPTLNVNGLGAKSLRRRISNSTMTTTFARYENWLAANRPVRVFYDGTFWIADFTMPNALDLYGTVEIEHGGTGGNTAAKARENLDVYSKAEVDALIAQAVANL